MSNEFYETRNLFRTAVGYNRPLSYDEWSAVADDHKVAVLYCQYFDQIVMAWYKSKSFYASEEEGVETVIQYLMKNVPIIQDNSSRYKASYIYRVAYNCLYCISHDRMIDKQRFSMEVSNVVASDSGDDLDLFDLAEDVCSDHEFDVDRNMLSKKFWQMMEDLDVDTKACIDNLLGEASLPKGFGDRKKRDDLLKTFKQKLEDEGWKSVFYDAE